MIELFVGKKGTGKTKQLVEGVNKASGEAKGNVVFITDSSSRNMYDIKYDVRMVSANDFSIKSYPEFAAFIEGMISGNYDITNIFIDAFFKIMGSSEIDGMEAFLERIDKVSEKFNVDFVISLSMDESDVPEYIKKYTK